MDVLAVVRAMRFCLGLFLIWGIFYIAFRRYLLDELRQKLFEIRDSVFDFAADGGIGFDDFCYRDLRDDINNLLLFADKLSFMRVLFAYWAGKRNPATNRLVDQWIQELDRLSPLAKKTLLEARVETWRVMIRYVIKRSVVLFVLDQALSGASLLSNAAWSLSRRLPNLAKPVEAQARDAHRLAA